MSRRLRLTLGVIVGLAVAVAIAAGTGGGSGSGSGPGRMALAADLSRFDPGNIISDGVFYDTSSMDVPKIQSFLDAQGAACSSSNGWCIRRLTQDTWTRPADTRCGAYQGATGETAATIVYKVAKACGVNPQVLLVTLQKEQGLIRATNPSSGTYVHAMGYGCPDTSACASEYEGFYNQLYSAAHQFKNYQATPSRYSYKPGMTNTIGYVPATASYNNVNNARCGTAAVYIQNQATAGLYNYTPYVPNAAALAAGYGSGDSCSAYGNRNFYNYFVDWFGSTQSSGGSSIVDKYTALKAAGVDLGAATSDIRCDQPNGGCWGGYAGGWIFWSKATGAHAVRGAILTTYYNSGGPSGGLGYPTGDDAATADGRGFLTTFQGGEIDWSAATGAQILRGAILSYWQQNNAGAGFLGFPTTSDALAPGGAGYVVDFQGGSVYWSAATGTHAVRGAILDRYKAVGGPTAVGYPTGEDTLAPGGNGYLSDFTGGSIYWSAATGAHIVRGAILGAYRAAGGPPVLGYPTGDETAASGNGYLTNFQNGSVYWSAPTGTHTVKGAILAAYVAAGGPAALGYPTGDDTATADGRGRLTTFQGGEIYSSAATGAHIVRGGILATWRAAGGEAGYLGFPTSDDAAAPGGKGYFTDFQYGSIYWSAATGSQIVRGAILAAYTGVGGPPVLGYPTGSDQPTRDGRGYVTTFQGGEIYWSSATGAHIVRGGILAAWKNAGAQAGFLGFPTSDDAVAPGGGGYFTDFQGGSIYWSPATGARFVRGGILASYVAAGGPAVLGFPISDDGPTAGGRGYFSAFQGGEIYWSSATGAHIVRGGILAAWKAAGAQTGYLGFPTSDDAAAPGGGGYFTDFQGGSIYWSASNSSQIVRGAILAAYRAAGGPAVLGFPTSSDTVAAGGGYYTDFTGGSIYWSAATGAHVVQGSVNLAYRGAGGTTSTYGFPVTDTYAVAGGHQVDFQHGTITR